MSISGRSEYKSLTRPIRPPNSAALWVTLLPYAFSYQP
jgi:hypothetical protein